MDTCNFYREEEIRKAKKEKRDPVPSFAITGSIGMIKQIISINQLREDYIWDTL